MADWASKANYNNPLFTFYHTLQFAKHKGMHWGKKRSLPITTATNARTLSVCLSPRAPPSRTGARNVKDGPISGVLSPCVILRSSACTFCHTGMFCRRVPKNLSLFSSNIVIHLSSSLDVCIGVRECTHAVLHCFIIPASDKD